MKTKTKTLTKNTTFSGSADLEIARRVRNFVKNLRRNVVAFGTIQNNSDKKYAQRVALAKKIATNRIVTSIENVLANNPTDSAITIGMGALRTELTEKVVELVKIKKNPDSSLYAIRRARGEEIATESALNRVVKLLA